MSRWIEEYEKEEGDYYTVEKEVFAEKVCVICSDTHIYSSIAKRIYHIRNALVHHKEGEISRYVPFSGQEKVISNELPLILFLAEQLILRTGKELI